MSSPPKYDTRGTVTNQYHSFSLVQATICNKSSAQAASLSADSLFNSEQFRKKICECFARLYGGDTIGRQNRQFGPGCVESTCALKMSKLKPSITRDSSEGAENSQCQRWSRMGSSDEVNQIFVFSLCLPCWWEFDNVSASVFSIHQNCVSLRMKGPSKFLCQAIEQKHGSRDTDASKSLFNSDSNVETDNSQCGSTWQELIVVSMRRMFFFGRRDPSL